eukprot:NODE_6706_length_853_cov_38.839726_g6108_i0.p1 GENE.NODE_6706_length_853_cov_38.839726_g6108_i0~~NODE_6706_length_853_cov_38.839726_g6108_i0.p1  ORF type:complete len:270 (+),score=30.41 NODE_6706_length_853_cov_38.839726_g6108_i0:107-811(+)
MATLGVIGDLFRWVELLLYVKNILLTEWNKRDISSKFSAQTEFEFAWQYPILLTVFMVVMTYSLFIPLLSLLGVIYFTVKFFVQKHHLRSNLYNNIDSMDAHQVTDQIKTLVGMAISNTVLCQVFIGAYLGILGHKAHAAVITILVGATIAVGLMIIAHNDYIANQRQTEPLGELMLKCQPDVKDVPDSIDSKLASWKHCYETPHLARLLNYHISPIEGTRISFDDAGIIYNKK